SMTRNRVLIAGATGQIGSSVAHHLLSRSNWGPVGLSRRTGQDEPLPMLAVDLLDAQDCRYKLQEFKATHVAYAARHDHTGGRPGSVDINLMMLSNLLLAVQGQSALRHIHVWHGTYYYGHNVGPGLVPYREDSPRIQRPLFYYAQQDYLFEQK